MTGGSGMTWAQKLAYSLPHVAMNFSGGLVAQRLVSFYNPSTDDLAGGAPRLMTAVALSALLLFGGIVDAFADPPVGYWSDGLRSRFGRRMPFIIVGTPVLVLALVAHFFPPGEGLDWRNVAWLAGVTFIYKVSFTVVVGPFESLLPEIARDTPTRVSLATWVAAATIVGNLLGAVLGELENVVGLQSLAWICGLALLAFLLVPIFLRETPHSEAKEPDMAFVPAMLSVYRNRAFISVLTMLVIASVALGMLVTNLDYFCKEILQRAPGEPGWVQDGDANTWRSILLATLFLGALLALPLVNWVAARMSNKALMVRAGFGIAAGMALFPAAVLFPEPAMGGLAAAIVLSFPVATVFVLARVFIAEIADYDEALHGKRREGVLNGALALVTKTGQGLGPAMVPLITTFGDTEGPPHRTGILLVGVVAAVLLALAIAAFRWFPEAEMHAAIADMERRRAEEAATSTARPRPAPRSSGAGAPETP